GGAPEAIREVWPDPPSGEDPVGQVPVSRPGALARGPPRHVRIPGVHPLLGPDSQGRLGGEAQDGQGPVQPVAEIGGALVPRAPPPPDPGAVGRPDEQAARALRVLRGHRQYGEGRQLPVPRETGLAEVAEPPFEQRPDLVGALRRAGAALSAAPGSAEGCPSGHVANSWPEGPDA